MKSNIEIKNRKAKFEYHFLEKYEAGMVLTGTEVKSLKLGNANLSDAYCLFHRNELILKKMYIAEYEQGNIHNHETRRDRKLLLKRQELKKLERKSTEKNLTIIPYRVYFNDRGIAKVEIVLAQGKKIYDKRQTIQERDIKRDMERIQKRF